MAPPAASWACHHVMPAALVGPRGNLAWHTLPFLCVGCVWGGGFIPWGGWPPPHKASACPDPHHPRPRYSGQEGGYDVSLQRSPGSRIPASLAEAFINGSAFSLQFSEWLGRVRCSLCSEPHKPEGKVKENESKKQCKTLVLIFFFFFLVVVLPTPDKPTLTNTPARPHARTIKILTHGALAASA